MKSIFLFSLVFSGLVLKAAVWTAPIFVKGVGNRAMAVVKEDNRLYVAVGSVLSVWDISSPHEPRKLGELGGFDNARQVAVQDKMAYVVSRETGLRIVDCHDPHQLRIRSRFDTVEFATGIEVVGKVAFVSERIYGVECVDVSNPDRPEHICLRKTFESQSCRYVDGYLYSGEWGDGTVSIFDAHDLRNFQKLGTVDLHGYGDGLTVDGDILYCSTGHDAKHRPGLTRKDAVGLGRGLDIFSIRDRAHPQHLARVDFPRFTPRNEDFWTVRVAAGRRLAFCADSHNGLFVVDVEDPTHPQLLEDRFCVPQPGRDWPSGAVSSLAVGEGCLYVTVNPGGLWVLPVAGIRSPVLKKGPAPIHVEYRESYPTDANAFYVYRPARAGQARSAVVRGDVVYAAFGDAGLHVLKIRPEGGFEKLGELSGRKVSDCCFVGEKLLTAEGLDGFALYSLKGGPVAFQEEIRRSCLSSARSVAFWCWAPTAGAVVLSGRNGGKDLLPLDKMATSAPLLQLGGSCQWDRYFTDRAIGDLVVDFAPYKCVQWVSLKPGEAPRLVKQDTSVKNDQCCGVCTFGNEFLITGMGARGPHVSFASPDEKVFGAPIRLPSGCGVPRSDGRFVGMNNRSMRSFFLYDFQDRTQPKLVARWQLSGSPDACAFYQGKVIIPAGYQGLLLQR